jgi:hypothetical protein
MRAANVKVLLSRDSLKQVFISELLQKGITDTKDGTRVEDLDYYSAKAALALAKIQEEG